MTSQMMSCEDIISFADSDQPAFGFQSSGRFSETRYTKGDLLNQKMPQTDPIRQQSNEEKMILESIHTCLKNWHQPWHESFLYKDGSEFRRIYDLIQDLRHYEQQIVNHNNKLPQERVIAIAKAVARLIDCGNSILDLDLIVRSANDELLSETKPNTITTIELFKGHVKAQKLREKLLYDYFRKETTKQPNLNASNASSRQISELDNPETSNNKLQVPSSVLFAKPGNGSRINPTGSNSSINSLSDTSPMISMNLSSMIMTPNQNDGNSKIQLVATSDPNAQLEVTHMTATIRGGAFSNPYNSTTRLSLLPGILNKIDDLMSSSPITSEKVKNCFELLDSLLVAVEKLPHQARSAEIEIISTRLLERLVRKVHVDDGEDLVDFEHAHWTCCLLSIIRSMTSQDFQVYLRHFSNPLALKSFLEDYLYIVKRLTSSNLNHNMGSDVPLKSPTLISPSGTMDRKQFGNGAFPNHWIDMNLVSSQTFLASLANIYHTLKQQFASNTQIWTTFINCLLNFLSQDSLKPGRRFLQDRQINQVDELRQSGCDYVVSAWCSLNPDQKQQSYEELLEPLLQVCLIFESNQRRLLLSIFYDMMRGDYLSQYATPRPNSICNSGASTVMNNGDIYSHLGSQISSQDARERIKSDDDLESLDCRLAQNAARDDDDQTGGMRHNQSISGLSLMNDPKSDEALAIYGMSQDGTVLTKFTHIMIEKLNKFIIELSLGDEKFKTDLSICLTGDLLPLLSDANTNLDDLASSLSTSSRSSLTNQSDSDRFKRMAKHTSDLVSEFIQICLDFKLATEQDLDHIQLLCLFKLILFFRDKVKRPELYLGYLYKLSCAHHKSGRYVEAGYTLYEYAKDLVWDKRPLEVHDRVILRFFHVQSSQLASSMDLKLFLYKTIIDYFDEGLLWEAAIPLCRELMDLHQTRSYDYVELVKLLSRMSQFYEKMIDSNSRSHPEYFRVTFYGAGFPECIRNCTMVYRGQAFEKLGDFQRNIMKQYPGSRLLTTLAKPSESLLLSEGSKLLQINACSPLVDLTTKFDHQVELKSIGDTILSYHKFNDCDKFQFSRRIPAIERKLSTSNRKINKDFDKAAAAAAPNDDDNFANLWRERTTLTTNTLPGMLPFFASFLSESTIVTPIECAIEDLEKMNDRLVSMVNRYKFDKRQVEDIRPLSQLLMGIVDPAVNGGISRYEQAFLNSTPLATNGQPEVTSSSSASSSSTRLGPAPKPRQRTTLMGSSSRVAIRVTPRDHDLINDDDGDESSNVNINFERTSATKHQYETPFGRRESIYDQLDTTAATQGNGEPEGTTLPEIPAPDELNYEPKAEQIERLKKLIAAQIPLLDEGIRLHRDRCPEVTRPQHEHLEASMDKLRRHVVSRYSRYLPSEYVSRLSVRASRSRSTRSPSRSIRSELRLLDLNFSPSSTNLSPASASFTGMLASNLNANGSIGTATRSRSFNKSLINNHQKSLSASMAGSGRDPSSAAALIKSNVPYQQFRENANTRIPTMDESRVFSGGSSSYLRSRAEQERSLIYVNDISSMIYKSRHHHHHQPSNSSTSLANERRLSTPILSKPYQASNFLQASNDSSFQRKKINFPGFLTSDDDDDEEENDDNDEQEDQDDYADDDDPEPEGAIHAQGAAAAADFGNGSSIMSPSLAHQKGHIDQLAISPKKLLYEANTSIDSSVYVPLQDLVGSSPQQTTTDFRPTKQLRIRVRTGTDTTKDDDDEEEEDDDDDDDDEDEDDDSGDDANDAHANANSSTRIINGPKLKLDEMNLVSL